MSIQTTEAALTWEQLTPDYMEASGLHHVVVEGMKQLFDSRQELDATQRAAEAAFDAAGLPALHNLGIMESMDSPRTRVRDALTRDYETSRYPYDLGKDVHTRQPSLLQALVNPRFIRGASATKMMERLTAASQLLEFSDSLQPSTPVLTAEPGGFTTYMFMQAGRSDGTPVSVTSGLESEDIRHGYQIKLESEAVTATVPSFATSLPKQSTSPENTIAREHFPVLGSMAIVHTPDQIHSRLDLTNPRSALLSKHLFVSGEESIVALASALAAMPESSRDHGWAGYGVDHTRLETAVRSGLLLLKVAATAIGIDVESDMAVRTRMDDWRVMQAKLSVEDTSAEFPEQLKPSFVPWRRYSDPSSADAKKFIAYLGQALEV
ncbi:MAG: hypothetical protein JWM81_352 [Candidatus Saccharibacteria bacterium]|nr:hypothetical protein [Candidatus Saccharibacteria bacterium]